MRCLQWILAVCAIGWCAAAAALNFDNSQYAVFETAPRSDGCRVVYAVPRSSLLMLGIDIPAPIPFAAAASGFRGTLCADGRWTQWQKTKVTAADMPKYGATPSTRRLSGVDLGGSFDGHFEGSGNPDIDTGHDAGRAPVAASGGRAAPVAIASDATDVTVASAIANFDIDLVGSIDAKFAVDASGAATYRVDVLAAPGTAGLAPRVSLNYASGDDDGIAGRGWSIGGLSSISRCRQTLVQDNRIAAIGFNGEDRFCLDGQRLILTGGVYGGNGSTYRTEIDSYAVITAYAGAVGQPTFFTVQRKDGSFAWYGDGPAQGSNNSAPGAALNGAAMHWSLSRFQDSVGNAMRFQYIGTASEQLISRIDYGYGSAVGNSGNSGTFIQFDYEARPDTSSGYVAGIRFVRTRRLASIRSFSSGAELRSYHVAYRTTDAQHPQSLVDRLFECVGRSCIAPTVFEWQINSGGFAQPTTAATVSGSYLSTLRLLDIDGDGRTDIVYRSLTAPYPLLYRLSNGLGFGVERTLVAATAKSSNADDLMVTTFDIDNDGRQDLLYVPMGTVVQTGTLFRGTAGGFAAGVAYDVGMNMPVAADIDGDGLPDLAGVDLLSVYRPALRIASNGVWTTAFGKKEVLLGVDGNVPAPPAGCPPAAWTMPLGLMAEGTDFNGDGRVDFPIQVNYKRGDACNSNFAGVAISRGGGDFTPQAWNAGMLLPPADMNGDGLTDLWYSDTAGNRVLRLSTGIGFTAPMTVGNFLLQKAIYLDYNGDGYKDLLWPSPFGVLVVQLFNAVTQQYDGAVATTIPYQAAGGVLVADRYLPLDIDGDGHTDLLRINHTIYGNIMTLYRSADAGGAGNRIVGIDNGLGGKTTIAYQPLTSGAIYTVATDANVVASWPGTPVFDVRAPHYVVSKVRIAAPAAHASQPDAIDQGAVRSSEYRYGGLKLQSGGRGPLGFAWIRTIDNQTGTSSTTWYQQAFPFTGQPARTQLVSAAGVTIGTTVNMRGQVIRSGADGTRYFQIYDTRVEEGTYDPVSGVETAYTVTEHAVPDEWGNDVRAVVSTFPANTHAAFLTQTVTDNSFGATAYSRRFGRLGEARIVFRRAGETDVVRTHSYTYYASGSTLEGLLRTESTGTTDGAPTKTTSYEYDAFGNRTRVLLSAAGESDRYTDTLYDPSGRFVASRSSEFLTGSGWAPQNIESVISRNAVGKPLQVRRLNGLVVTYAYDVLGREIERSENSGAMVRTQYLRSDRRGAQYQIKTTAATGAVAVEYFDALARSVAKGVTGFDGRWIYSETEYDAIGRIKRQSEPHYAGEAIHWTTNTHDAFRLLRRSIPAAHGLEATTSFGYRGTIATTTNALRQTRTEERNAAGELVRVVDPAGGVIDYIYDAIGQVRRVANSGRQQGRSVSIVTEMTYDALGRKTKMVDTDKGTWFYRYNGFDELIDEYKVMAPGGYGGTLAMALSAGTPMQHTQHRYDRRGRPVERIDYDIRNQPESIARWQYDTQAHGLGQPAQDFIEGRNVGHIYGYDDYGRPAARLSGNDEVYIEETTYDAQGRVATRTDAVDSGSGIRNRYNAFGYLEAVEDLATGTELYRAQQRDARGNVTRVSLGNGATTQRNFDAGSGMLLDETSVRGKTALQDNVYTWDLLGNPTSRWDRGVLLSAGTKNQRQSFCYDTLNRLIKTHRDTVDGSCALGAAQQDQEYDDFGNIARKAGIGMFTYDTARPHRLMATGDGVSYSYDAVGNLTADSSGRTLSYTVFDKPAAIARGALRTTFGYGIDREPLKRIDTDAAGARSTTYWLGDVEKVVKPDGSYELRRHIGDFALWTHRFDPSGRQLGLDRQYAYRDPQGSLVLLTDEAGGIRQQFAYDAWGRRVWVISPTVNLQASAFLPVAAQRTTEGFTGHEMLDGVGLIHMRGRVYDQRLGRFVQPDPFVQAPAFLQSFNRYAYVFNTPLRLVDPSGFNGAGDDAVTLGKILGSGMFGEGTVLPTIQVDGGYGNSYSSYDAVNGYGFFGGGIGFSFSSAAVATPSAISAYGTAGSRSETTRMAGKDYRRKEAVEPGKGFLPGDPVADDTSMDCHTGICYVRASRNIYLTGHRVRGIGPFHTALEYSSGVDVEWISAGYVGYTYEGMSKLVVGIGNLHNQIRRTDRPDRNVRLGLIVPPSGLTPEAYFQILKDTSKRYDGSADYDLFPGIADGYNSNSFTRGLIDATGGTSTIDLDLFVGGEKPLPQRYFPSPVDGSEP